MPEVFSLFDSVTLPGECSRGDGRAETCTALIEEEHLEFSRGILAVTNDLGSIQKVQNRLTEKLELGEVIEVNSSRLLQPR